MCKERDEGLIIENNDILSPKEEEDLKEYFENVVGMKKGKLVVQPLDKD